jgi:arginyl-tRNA synthetase
MTPAGFGLRIARMKPIVSQLEQYFHEALVKVVGAEAGEVDPLIRPSTDPKFGDYQSNVAMGLAKRLGRKPREIAQQVVDALQAGPAVAELCEPFEIAGPGFINIRLSSQALAARLSEIPPAGEPDRLGIEPAAAPQTVVVDYSGPNIAKEMHVGHIRSTIIGDSIARVLEFGGHRAIRQNHIGDWGTQFGMLCAFVKETMPAALERPEELQIRDLEGFYRQANARDKEDAAFHERARAEVVALHNHEESTLRAWRAVVEASRRNYTPIYERLGVGLRREDERGESFYADRLPEVVKELAERFGGEQAARARASGGMSVEESDGALCVFHWDANGAPVFKNPEGKPFPLIIRKSDGAFLYATTDLAAMRFRVGELGTDRIIYVTDARQALHFQMVFATARAAGWTHRRDAGATPTGKMPVPQGEVELDHVTFGSILGEDRKPLKTRSGENVKLAELLDEAVGRAETLIRGNEADEAKRRGFTEVEIHDIAEAVGVGALKYADLSQNRQSDYVFSWDKMLAMEGNTAPYLMYAYARIRSIYRKGGEVAGTDTASAITLGEPAERALSLQILRFAEIVEGVAKGLRINVLTDYLYELSGLFMKFYESCPVLAADTPQQRASRLRLCDLAARTLRIGLDLLGIRVVERM